VGEGMLDELITQELKIRIEKHNKKERKTDKKGKEKEKKKKKTRLDRFFRRLTWPGLASETPTH
jgi:hypothetical protein